MNRPVAIDLFSGVGGLSLGLEQAGFYVAIKVEIEEIAGTYAQYNAPNSLVLFGDEDGDANNFGAHHPKVVELKKGNQEIALVAGGPPCQGFSIAGKKNAEDPLNNLVIEFARVVTEIKPLAFVMENVPGITVGGSGMLQRALEVLGREYDIAGPETLSAWHYGVPQMRQRVFIIGYRKDLGTTPSLPQPTHHFDNNEQGALFLKQTPNAWDALSDIPAVDDFQELLSGDRVAYETEPLTDFQREMRGELRLNDDFSFTIEWDNAVCTNLRRTQHGESLLSRLETLDFGKADKVSGIRRIDPNELCTTIRAGTTKARGSWSAPRPLHPYQHRVLTTRECARIQTFPDWWEFHPAKWHGNRMVGNAVPPRLAKAVGSNISRELGVEPVHVAGDVLSRDFSLIADYVEKAHKSNYENRKVSQKVFSWSAKKMGATN